MPIKLLLVLHAAVAVALAGAATHNGLLALRAMRGRAGPAHLERLYPRVVLWLYLASVGLGSVLYPTFRVDVRAAYLDHALPLGSALFEIKEHVVAFGLAAALVQRRLAGLPERGEAERLLFDLSRATVSVAVLYAGLVGLFLVSVRSV